MASNDDSNDQVEVTIRGLQKKEVAEGGNPYEEHTMRIIARTSDLLDDVWAKFLDAGYESPPRLMCGDKAYIRGDGKSVMLPSEKVVVVADDQPSTKNQIRLCDTLLSHSNIHYGKQLEFNINEAYSHKVKKPATSIKSTSGFEMSFQRTPRMPDDNKLHQLPASLGSYDLYNVGAYADRLPENIREAGGVFLAMWQREAMWINFEPHGAQRWAVRVFVGRINAVSGLKMDEVPAGKDEGAPLQDYVVIPGQEWLDGICVAPGVVRQFVAMPLGSGYTIEGQKTSEEKYGGLQIEIIPEFEKGLRWWAKQNEDHVFVAQNGSKTPNIWEGLDETSTASELGLEVGDILLCYPQPAFRYAPLQVQDLPVEDGKAICQAQYPEDIRRRLERQRAISENKYNVVTHGFTRNTIQVHDSLEYQYSAGSRPTNMRTSRSSKSYSVIDRKAVEVNGLDPDYETKSCPQETIEITEESKDDGNEVVDIEETADLKAMGLAAGGKLVQDIYKDSHPAYIWNHAAARIVNIHILDPKSCEKVTHIVPLPPPESIGQYIEHGGQFFVVEEQVDERVEGGDFDKVKSVSQMDKHIGVTTEPEFDPTKPKMCNECKIRLCDCIIRPCDHQFCNICIKKIEEQGGTDTVSARKKWKCPNCGANVHRVAGFSAPMNLPGEETVKTRVPVNVLRIKDGRVRFQSVQKSRV